MREPSNRKKVMLTLILSAEDNDVLTEAAKEVGLKKSEYLRAIIQGIGAGTRMQKQIDKGHDINIEVEGYGVKIPIGVMEELLQDVGEKLMGSVNVTELNPQKYLRNKRMKPMVEAL